MSALRQKQTFELLRFDKPLFELHVPKSGRRPLRIRRNTYSASVCAEERRTKALKTIITVNGLE
jgi:hypothetical protein